MVVYEEGIIQCSWKIRLVMVGGQFEQQMPNYRHMPGIVHIPKTTDRVPPGSVNSSVLTFSVLLSKMQLNAMFRLHIIASLHPFQQRSQSEFVLGGLGRRIAALGRKEGS